MEQLLFVFVHIGLPILIGISIFWDKPRSKTGLFAAAFFYIAYLWFIYLWGQWPIAISYYFKYIVLAILSSAVVITIMNYKYARRTFPKGVFKNTKNTILFLLGLFFLVLVVDLYKGRNYKGVSVSLEFPLKNGSYYIASGGSNKVINNHYGTSVTSQHYALDINKIGAAGKIFQGMESDKNEGHYIFAEPLYSPCAGKVIALKTSVEDNMGSSMDVSAENGQGNFIALNCDNTIVTMVHLKKKSIVVTLGEQVKKGQLLGKVGNSGFSQEPHLHIQAAQYNIDSILVGVPMAFNERLLYRNEIFRN
ncbi:M23 family metallopeptidase [Spongiimicrobium sp. 3-5]|uniref:M23 family metallopeptidase n=1 Tax=Spongiimicrobium sp. 3-5 TaxID=3332596 RepID=UPI00397F585E